MVERYSPSHENWGRVPMEPDATGCYVHYSDYADLERQIVELRAERDQQTKEINALLVAAASKGEEPDLMLSEWRNALARAERAEEAFEIAKAHRDRLESAARRQIQNIEHWLETSEPASPEESQSIYEQLKAALSGSSDPRKDVARRCVEIAQFHPNSVIGKLISEKIASEFSLDTKEGTDAGE